MAYTKDLGKPKQYDLINSTEINSEFATLFVNIDRPTYSLKHD